MGKSFVARRRATRGMQCGVEYADVVFVDEENLPNYTCLPARSYMLSGMSRFVCSEVWPRETVFQSMKTVSAPTFSVLVGVVAILWSHGAHARMCTRSLVILSGPGCVGKWARQINRLLGSGEGTENCEICFIAFVSHSLQCAMCGYRYCLRRLLTAFNRSVRSPAFPRGDHGSMMPSNCTYAICHHSASFPVAAVVGGLLLLRRPDPYARRLLMSSFRPAFQFFNPSSQPFPRPSSSCPCRPSFFCGPSCASSASMPCTLRRSG